MKMARRQANMYGKYGKEEGHICKECSNLIRYEHRGRNYKKCAGYGDTRSESSDWAISWAACGHFNKPFPKNDRPLIECLKAKKDVQPLEGQMTIGDE